MLWCQLLLLLDSFLGEENGPHIVVYINPIIDTKSFLYLIYLLYVNLTKLWGVLIFPML